jgi:hypothetical protein
MLIRLRTLAPWLVGLVLVFVAAPAFAQVPQDTTFTGRLVDDLGNPLPGPVDLTLGIFDVSSGGTPLYAETHSGVPLDATGGFSVELGLGTPGTGTFDAALFSGVDRWLQVLVDGTPLTPRENIGSAPWALIAQQANEVVPDPNGAFKDCGDGTIWDPKTGLQWEMKTGDDGLEDLSDPHDVDNQYSWSTGTDEPDGTAFTDFLAKLNDPTFGEAATSNDLTGCFAGRCDWRLPSIRELKTILDCSLPEPCLDTAVFGPSASSLYWSASTRDGLASNAWITICESSVCGTDGVNSSKTDEKYVRAVRAGSCH